MAGAGGVENPVRKGDPSSVHTALPSDLAARMSKTSRDRIRIACEDPADDAADRRLGGRTRAAERVLRQHGRARPRRKR